MKTLILYLASAILLGFATSASAESIAWESCPVSNGISADSCTVHDVNIQPCGQTTSGGSCRLRRGRPITFGVDFTPNFSGGELQTSVVWKHPYMDLPMDESWNDLNPCSSTACPLTAGTRQNYNRTFTLHYASWPRDYRLEWKLWNGEEKYCCGIFTVTIIS